MALGRTLDHILWAAVQRRYAPVKASAPMKFCLWLVVEYFVLLWDPLKAAVR